MIVKMDRETDGGNGARLSDYFRTGVNEVDGWLAEPAMFVTAQIDRWQKENHIPGAIGEIGVWRGKYLILLYLLARPNEAVVAVDSFVHLGDIEPCQKVIHNVIKHAGNATQLVFLQKDSLTLTPADLLQNGRGQYRLFSIDGGHELKPVLSDLRLVTQVLAPGGVIAMDDFFNSGTPGVMEGGYRFMYEENRGRIAPFAYVANKLFLTTTSHYAFYYKAMRDLLDRYKDRDDFKRTLEIRGHLEHANVKVEMFGHEIISVI